MDDRGNPPFRIRDHNGIVRGPRIECEVGWVISIVPSDRVWKPAAWIVVPVKHVSDAVSSFRSSQTCPEDLKNQIIPRQYDGFTRQKVRCVGQLTAVTFGLSIQDSMLSGPTELTTTIVFV